MKRILITGANSYIGTSFATYITNNYHNEYIVDTIDMLTDDWKKIDFSKYDTIYHVAGIAHSDIGKIGKEREKIYREINTLLAIVTAKKAKDEGVSQFIFMSSAIVYGESAPVGQEKVITRDTPLSPANCYGESKVEAERGIAALGDDDFNVVILRCPMVYGRGSKGNYPVLAKFAKKLPVFPYVKKEENRKPTKDK